MKSTLAHHGRNGSKTAAVRPQVRPAISRKSHPAPEREIERDHAETTGSPYRLEGLDRVVAILDLLGESDNSLSLAEICRQMSLRKSTAHRALMALERTGLIERAPSHRYRLGLKLYDMGNRAVEQIDLRSRVHPYLRKLALRVGHTVHLGVLHKTRVVYIDKIEPINRHVCISSRTGTSNPVYSTSLGKAILAFLPPEQIEQTVAAIQFVTFTSKTLTSGEELTGALERVRRRGFSVDDEEMELGTRCVGAPVFDGAGNAIAAVSVSGPASRLTAHCVPIIAEHLIRCCQEISRGFATQDTKLLVRASGAR
jgi:DNA-binding IclR family transcriptional regulator